jgi:hypothetical protein
MYIICYYDDGIGNCTQQLAWRKEHSRGGGGGGGSLERKGEVGKQADREDRQTHQVQRNHRVGNSVHILAKKRLYNYACYNTAWGYSFDDESASSTGGIMRSCGDREAPASTAPPDAILLASSLSLSI